MKSVFKKISVIGLGYIGLPTAALLASRGIDVYGLDVKKEVVDTINEGLTHISEPNLNALVQQVTQSGNLRAGTSPEAADAYIIAVPTPIKDNTKTPDITFVKAAVSHIAGVLKKGDLLIIESTCPVGTTRQAIKWLASLRPDLQLNGADQPDVHLAYCPERVLPGKMLVELISNDRVVGGITPTCAELAKQLYQIFVKGEVMLASSAEMAELTKLTENSFRDVNIAFANELSLVAAEAKVDISELIALANRHPRVDILSPGPGVGGHCIAVDPWFIASSFPTCTRLIQTSRAVNDSKPNWVIENVRQLAKMALNKKVICCGLTFKENVDDVRESPSMQIFKALRDEFGDRVVAIDPQLDANSKIGLNQISLAELESSDDILLMLVPHAEFLELTPSAEMIFDTRGVWRRTLPSVLGKK